MTIKPNETERILLNHFTGNNSGLRVCRREELPRTKNLKSVQNFRFILLCSLLKKVTFSFYVYFSANVFSVCEWTFYVFFFFYRWAWFVQFKDWILFNVSFHLIHKSFCRFEGRNVVGGNDDGRVLGNIPCGFFSPFFHDKTTKSP